MKKPTEKMTARQKSTLTRRRHIVESAAFCFLEQGFHQTSIRDIAKHAGISVGNLYNHFDSKTALIAEIASLEADDMGMVLEVLDRQGAPEDRLIAFVKRYFDYLAQPENAVLAAEITAEAMRSPEITEGFFENRRQLVERLRHLLSHEQSIPTDHVVSMAETLVDAIEGAAFRTAFATKKERNEAHRQLQRLVLRLVFLRRED